MSRTPGVRPPLTLPTPPASYSDTDQREMRRLIERFALDIPDWVTFANTPTPVTALGGVTGAADTVPYFTSVSAMALATLTPYARTILAAVAASDARTVLGLGDLAVLNVATESEISLADVTTDDVSTSKHGFAPKAPGNASVFLDGTGNYSAPATASGAPAWTKDAPFTEAASPNAADDEFGGTDYASENALDTGATRRVGSTAWAWNNQSTTTATVVAGSGGGRLILAPPADGKHHGVEQAISGTFKIRAKIALGYQASTNTQECVIYVKNSGTGRVLVFGIARVGGNYGFHSSRWNSLTSWNSDVRNPDTTNDPKTRDGWVEVESDGTNVIFRYSASGVEGTFWPVYSETLAAWVSSVTHVGLSALQSASDSLVLVCDTWKRVA